MEFSEQCIIVCKVPIRNLTLHLCRLYKLLILIVLKALSTYVTSYEVRSVGGHY